jgi:hypothetical protein
LRAGALSVARLGFADAVVHYHRPAPNARAHDDAASFADAALGAYRVSVSSGAIDRAVALLEEALELLGDRDAGRRAAVLSALALGLHFAEESERLDAYSAEAVSLARRVGSPQALGAALAAQHMTMLAHEDLSARLTVTAEGFRLGAQSDPAPWLQRCHIIDLLEAGDSAAAEQQVDVYAHRAERSGLPHLRWHARVLRSTLALLAGRFADVERISAEALATRRDARDPATDQVLFLASLGRRALDELDELREHDPLHRPTRRTRHRAACESARDGLTVGPWWVTRRGCTIFEARQPS